MDSAQHDRLRVLVAVPFTPRADAMHGGRVIAQFLHELSQRHALGLVYLRRAGMESIDPVLAARCEFVEEVDAGAAPGLDSRWRRRWQVLSGPFTGVPSPVRASYDRRLGEVLARLARVWQPDVIQLEHDALAQCGASIREHAPVAILVCHEPGLDAALELARATAGRQRVAHLLDARIWRRYWKRNLPYFDSVVVFTEEDRRAMEPAANGVPVVTIPLGIEIPVEPLDPRGSADSIAYVGGYQHPPNADAAVRLMRSIAPRIRRQVPALRVMIVGAAPTVEMRAAASPEDHITGAVPSVTPYLNESAVVALPIRLGGGMRVKLLEALAAGKAVVASPRAIAGLDVEAGMQLEVAETDDDFAAAVVALLADESRRVAVAGRARAWAAANLGWDVSVQRYDELYRSLLAGRP